MPLFQERLQLKMHFEINDWFGNYCFQIKKRLKKEINLHMHLTQCVLMRNRLSKRMFLNNETSYLEWNFKFSQIWWFITKAIFFSPNPRGQVSITTFMEVLVLSNVWWFISVIEDLERQRHKDYEINASLNYTVRNYLRNAGRIPIFPRLSRAMDAPWFLRIASQF